MSNFPVSIQGLDELLTRLKNAPDIINKTVDAELDDGAKQMATLAVNNAPGNTGALRQGIGSEKTAPLSYDVYSNVEYSPFIEFGTGAQVQIPSGLEEYAAQFKGSGFSGVLSAKDAIYAWCKDKGIEESAWYAIFVSIMNNGIAAQPFFFKAKDVQEPIIIKNVTEALNDAI